MGKGKCRLILFEDDKRQNQNGKDIIRKMLLVFVFYNLIENNNPLKSKGKMKFVHLLIGFKRLTVEPARGLIINHVSLSD